MAKITITLDEADTYQLANQQEVINYERLKLRHAPLTKEELLTRLVKLAIGTGTRLITDK